MTISCPYCRTVLPTGRVTCQSCGQRLPEPLRSQAAAARERLRLEKESQRRAAQEEREQARRYAQEMTDEAAVMTRDLESRVEELEGLLAHTLDVDDFVSFDSFKETLALPEFKPGKLDVEESEPKFNPPTFVPPPDLGFFKRKSKKARQAHEELTLRLRAEHEVKVAEAKREHEEALERWKERETKRKRELKAAKEAHKREVEEVKAKEKEQHDEMDDMRDRFDRGEPDAIAFYFQQVVQRSDYPPDFPRGRRVAYVPESKQLVVELELPPFESVPAEASFRYVKSRDEITSTQRPATKRKALYSDVVAQVVLRTLHEVFEADRSNYIETAVVNGHVDTIDKATGQRVRPCLVTVRSGRDAFESLDLAHVEPAACLKTLHAAVSRSPSEFLPVKPVVDFNMVDPRFVEESDVLAGLDQRPNLMDLNPFEFEALITNLFTKMGLETRMTRASRDGGVDCVAWDPRPILGGKVVIQAKRYKNTVGTYAVRDLFGTMQNEGASKGILITTSGYGKSSYEFAEGKPMELLSGSNLLYLLAEHAGIEAKIEPPEDWVDPNPNLE